MPGWSWQLHELRVARGRDTSCSKRYIDSEVNNNGVGSHRGEISLQFRFFYLSFVTVKSSIFSFADFGECSAEATKLKES